MVCITKVQRSTGKKAKMLEIPTVRLRTMSASIKTPRWITLVFDDDSKVDVHYPTILTSYKTDVAVYDNNLNVVYLLPDYDCSNTTMKHLHAFIEDFTYIQNKPIKDIRKDAATTKTNYFFCKNLIY